MSAIADQIDSTSELSEAIYESLRRKGTLNQIKARVELKFTTQSKISLPRHPANRKRCT